MAISRDVVRAFIACGVFVALVGTASGQVLTFTEASGATGIVADHARPPGMLYAGNASGGGVGDFNNDGWADLFILGGLNPDMLFINNGDGTFREEASAWGVAMRHMGTSVTVADFNGDGWMNIAVSSQGPIDGLPAPGMNLLYRNNGDGTFTDIAASAGVQGRGGASDPFAVAFGDYDGDGHLDLFTTAYSTASRATACSAITGMRPSRT